MDEKINNNLVCSFCGTVEKDVNFLVEGQDAFICDICIDKANEIVIEKLTALSKNNYDNQTKSEKENKNWITQEQLDKKIEELIKKNNNQKKEITEFYKKDENINNLHEQLLNNKLFEVINEFAINKISEKPTSDLRKEK